MALNQQTEQLFARVFGRGPETPEQRNILKDIESRKGIGTPESLGAIQFQNNRGNFGQAGSAPADPGTIDAMTSGIDTLKKKYREIDQHEKKLFREEQKLEVKKQLLSDPGFKSLLDERNDLRQQLSQKDFGEDIPYTPGVTNPLDVSRAAIGTQEGISSFANRATDLAREGDTSITNIIDRLGDQRQADYDNARQSLADLITIRQEDRADELHQVNLQKSQFDLYNLASGMTPEQRARLALDVADQYDVTVDEANEIVDRFAGGFTSSSGGMRTDRHNNPTAFTTDVARQAGLELGVDYTIGDPFPNNPAMRTARLLGDPIDKTIKAIDKIGFYTQGGKPRWSYLSQIPEHKRWKSLSNKEKRDVIAQMYEREGGSGSLLQGGQPVVTEVTPVETDPSAGLKVETNAPGLMSVSGGLPSFTILGGGQNIAEQAQKYLTE